ncbi:glycosidase [Longilinea arvoryzae]|uniref:Glycosidase n=1 Tax=Longilinea arvoryzae TaxID=360412 RepID=A0A0S7BK36_9CHLR|nr:alpha-amylase family glycosyl hydrolase [Longilinea arvoryzae]GAP15524.1 glycosidase [Longilinea arvoryzae]
MQKTTPTASVDPAARSLERLLPRLDERYRRFARQKPQEWRLFRSRLEANFPRLFNLLLPLYGGQYDFFYHLENLLDTLAQAWIERRPDLKALDERREADPGWFQSNRMLGGVGYVDLYAGNLDGIRAKIPYFTELGLTYLHLMPLFRAPEGENDGGYAISSYREVDPRLGSMAGLADLAGELRQNGISLVVDFVFNHTSNEHTWALQARAGDPEYLEYYLTFPDRGMPDAYEKTLREIFPDEHPGAFTYFADMQRWVWTTFHSYQWDLNYRNPAVFTAMAGELLALANAGVEVLRLDAVAFIWKQMGTACENLPEAHRIIQAFNAVARIAAPALLFKSEAIVHPDDVARYISLDECQLSYNPLLMALLWESLATRDVRLLDLSLRERYQLKPGCAWVNYVRVHDDIGWTFSDEDAARLGIEAYGHRRFLNDFFTGRFPGSFARGLPFQENPKTGDCRISGTCASLAGLEKAVNEETEREVELAIRRILLIYAVILTTGGVPLIYLGDEIGTLNDYAYRNDPRKLNDSRWVHRPAADWERMQRRSDPASLEGRVYQGLQRLIQLRKSCPALTGGHLQGIETGSTRVLGYLRVHEGEQALILANFSEQPQIVPANQLRLYGLSYHFTDLVSGVEIPYGDLHLDAYDFYCLQGA